MKKDQNIENDLSQYPLTMFALYVTVFSIALGPFLTFVLTEDESFYRILPFIVVGILGLVGATVFIQIKERKNELDKVKLPAQRGLFGLFLIVTAALLGLMLLPVVEWHYKIKAMWLLPVSLVSIATLKKLIKQDANK